MSEEEKAKLRLEIGHVLFIDIVGYSKLLINEQSEQIQKLKEIARGTEQFKVAEAEGKLLRLPTGDGKGKKGSVCESRQLHSTLIESAHRIMQPCHGRRAWNLPVGIAPRTNRFASGEENWLNLAEIHRLTPIAC
jgi:hypothetical protein